MVVFLDNIKQQGLYKYSSNFIFPINSILPNHSHTMLTRFNHKNQDINNMEKLTYALNLTSTLAFSLGIYTPFSNIGNLIPMGVFYNNKTLITDFYKQISIFYS